MWSRVAMILPILVALYQTKAIKQPEDSSKQPEDSSSPFDDTAQAHTHSSPSLHDTPPFDDTPVFDEMAFDSSESNEELASDSPESNNERPPLENYLKLRQNNADMAMQVEHLATETHELKHRVKVAKAQERLAVAKIMKKCPTGPRRFAATANHEAVKMPWSLTHTATRHKQKRGSWFPGEETIRGFFDGFKALSTGIPTEQLHRSYATAGTVGQIHKDVVELHNELKITHVRLGRVQEVKSNLEAHYQALTEKVATMQEEATKDQQQLDTLAANERTLDQQLAAIRQTQDAAEKPDATRTDIKMSAEDQVQRESKIKMEAEKLHEEADRRLQESSKETSRLRTENQQLQEAIDASQARQPTEQTKLLNTQNSIVESNNTAAKLKEQAEQLKEAEAAAKQKEVAEDNALMASASQDERCFEWTTKLEAKLKHVVQGKKDDASLCHNSILGLHKERINLKDGNAKMHTKLKNLKHNAEEMLRKGDETLATLNSCLGR